MDGRVEVDAVEDLVDADEEQVVGAPLQDGQVVPDRHGDGGGGPLPGP